MKFSDYILVFIIVFFGFSIILFRTVNTYSESGITNTEYANKLTTACNDAAKTIHLENVKDDGVWLSAEDRNETLETFYNTLEYCFNADDTVQESEIKVYTPIVCLVDLNGYYVAYNSSFDETVIDGEKIIKRETNANNANIEKQYKKMVENTITVSNLNTWATTYNSGFTVRYFLNDHIEIITPTGKIVSGTRADVDDFLQQELAKNNPSGTYGISTANLSAEQRRGEMIEEPSINDLLRDDSVYASFKNSTVIQQINKTIEYYINQQNLMASTFDIPYKFTMPEIKSEDWCRLLENPTVLSFLQGSQMITHTGYINVYSLAGGELIKEKMYFITSEVINEKDVLTYHYIHGRCGADLIRNEGTNTVTVKDGTKTKTINYKYYYFTYKGQEIKTFYSSMEECAKKGAYPCECVYNYNNNQ